MRSAFSLLLLHSQDRVLVEAGYNPNMPFKWNATRIQVLPNQRGGGGGGPPQAPSMSQGNLNPTATPNNMAFSNAGGGLAPAAMAPAAMAAARRRCRRCRVRAADTWAAAAAGAETASEDATASATTSAAATGAAAWEGGRTTLPCGEVVGEAVDTSPTARTLLLSAEIGLSAADGTTVVTVTAAAEEEDEAAAAATGKFGQLDRVTPGFPLRRVCHSFIISHTRHSMVPGILWLSIICRHHTFMYNTYQSMLLPTFFSFSYSTLP